MESSEASSEPTPLPPPGRLERWAPWAFVVLGVAMIVVAAVGYLDSAVSAAFVIVGTALLVLGGLASRIEGTIKIGLRGFEVAVRAQHHSRQVLLEAQRRLEAVDAEQAEQIGAEVDKLDDWFDDYLSEVAKGPRMTPFEKAALLQDSWQRAQRPTGRYRGGAIVPGVDTEDEPRSKPGPGAA